MNREPVPEALAWIESEMDVLLEMQRPDGHFEYWYGEGNFNRTALLYALMQSRGVRPAVWQKGVGIGAVPAGDGLRLHVKAPAPLRVQFDYARHRRVMNLDRNYVRLNEFPEWFVVDENARYDLTAPSGESMQRLGAELVRGVTLAPGEWVVVAGRRRHAIAVTAAASRQRGAGAAAARATPTCPGQRRLEPERPTRDRVLERELPGVQRLSRKRDAADRRRVGVHLLPHQRMAAQLRLQPDLIALAGDQPHLDQRGAAQPLQHAVLAQRLLASGVARAGRALNQLVAIPDQMVAPAAGLRGQVAVHDRLIDPLRLATQELPFQVRERRAVLGEHHQARGIAIDAMHDLRASLSLRPQVRLDQFDQRLDWPRRPSGTASSPGGLSTTSSDASSYTTTRSPSRRGRARTARPLPGPIHPHPHDIAVGQRQRRIGRRRLTVADEDLPAVDRRRRLRARAQPVGRGQELVEPTACLCRGHRPLSIGHATIIDADCRTTHFSTRHPALRHPAPHPALSTQRTQHLLTSLT